MNSSKTVIPFFKKTTGILYLALLTGLVFNIRALASLSLGALTVLLAVSLAINRRPLFRQQQDKWLWLICLLFFLWQSAGVLFSLPTGETGSVILLKSAIVTAPLIVLADPFSEKADYRKILDGLTGLLVLALLYCYCWQGIHFVQGGDPALFFYHELLSPLRHHHAVQFSLLVLLALSWLLFEKKEMNRFLRTSLIVFLGISMILLSSRLVNFIFLVVIVFFVFRQLRTKKFIRLAAAGMLVAGMGILFCTDNPFAARFKELLQDNLAVWNKERFEKSDYLNGAQFRLMQWKLVPDMLNEQNAWHTGVGMTRSQYWLDQQYTRLNLYTGEAGKTGSGYLGYNTHNQFLESLLQSGWPGLLFFTALFLLLWWRAVRLRNFFALAVVISNLLLAFTESVLETQYGIILFLFIPLFVIRCQDTAEKNNRQGNPAAG